MDHHGCLSTLRMKIGHNWVKCLWVGVGGRPNSWARIEHPTSANFDTVYLHVWEISSPSFGLPVTWHPTYDRVLRIECMDRERTKVTGPEGFPYRTRVHFASIAKIPQVYRVSCMLQSAEKISIQAFNVLYNSRYPRKKHTQVLAT